MLKSMKDRDGGRMDGMNEWHVGPKLLASSILSATA